MILRCAAQNRVMIEMNQNTYEIHGLENKDLPVIFWDAGKGTTPNWHENMELLYCRAGKGTLICGGTEFAMVPGHIYAINANELHSVFDLGQLNYDCLIVDSNFLAQNKVYLENLELETDIISAEAEAVFNRIALEMKSPDPFRAAMIRSLCLQFIVHLFRHFSRGTSSKESSLRGTDASVKRAVGFIKGNFDRKLTLEEIAEEVGFSKYYFTRIFKKATGMTVVAYINLVRCRKAKKLLEQQQMSVFQAASLCGFENASYFSKTFQQVMGMLPSEVGREE